MSEVQSGACEFGLIFAVFSRFRHIGHMTGDAVHFAVRICVFEDIGLNGMTGLAVLLHRRIADVGHPSCAFNFGLIVAREASHAVTGMHAHEMLGGLVVVVGFGKRAKLFLRELDLGFRVDSEGLQETVHAFDLKGNVLEAFRSFNGNVVLCKGGRGHRQARQCGQENGCFES